MELAGNILALALLLLHGALVLGARAARVSVAVALRVMREVIEAVRHLESTSWWRRDMRAAVRDEYERNGSKRARDFPAKKKRLPQARKTAQADASGKTQDRGVLYAI